MGHCHRAIAAHCMNRWSPFGGFSCQCPRSCYVSLRTVSLSFRGFRTSRNFPTPLEPLRLQVPPYRYDIFPLPLLSMSIACFRAWCTRCVRPGIHSVAALNDVIGIGITARPVSTNAAGLGTRYHEPCLWPTRASARQSCSRALLISENVLHADVSLSWHRN